MSLLDTLNPSFLPDLSKAKKVTGYASVGEKSMMQFEGWLKKKSNDELKRKNFYKAAVKSESEFRKELEQATKEYEAALQDYAVFKLRLTKLRKRKENRQRSLNRAIESLKKWGE